MKNSAEQTQKFWLNTKELIALALLSSLGGTLSSFVSYLGLQLNLIAGTSQGAGQILAGAHTFWLILISVLIPQFGSITMAGILKGFVELFTGSSHGVLVVLYSISQGVVIELVMWVFNRLGRSKHSILTLSVACGLSNISVIFISIILFYNQLPFLFLLIMLFTAFISGIIFGGFLAYDVITIIKEADLWQFSEYVTSKGKKAPRQILKKPVHVITLTVLLIFILVGSIFALVTIQAQFTSPYTCSVIGKVHQPYTFHYDDFLLYETKIEAKLDGAYTHLPVANYTGIPLNQIILHAKPKNNAKHVTVIATDRYEAKFNLSSVLNDNSLILSKETQNQWLWLIAGDYAGGYWVKMVSTIKIS